MATRHPKIRSYLDHLTFPPELGRGFLRSYITNIRLVILLIVAIALMGYTSFLLLPKRLNPEVKIPIVTIVTAYPGAGPADIESQVTIPLENAARGVADVDTVTSVSRDNLSVISTQFNSGIDPDRAKDLMQSAIDTVTALPSGAQRPTVKRLDFEDQPIWTFALSSRGSVPDLMRSADELKRRLEDEGRIDRVIVSGLETQEITIEIDPVRLATYNISANDLASKVRAARLSHPAGTIKTAENTFSVTIDPSIESTTQLRALPIQIGGEVVPLGSIATVLERSQPGISQSYLAQASGHPVRTVLFNVYKTKDTNIGDAGATAKQVIDSYLGGKNNQFSYSTILNTSEDINTQFAENIDEFKSTIILVAIVLLLFLGLRQALISCLTVPLTFLSSFVIMRMTGMTINFLSLFAFLLSLGLLVDDTIVVVSTMTSYHRSGKFSAVETGLLAWRDTIIPIWSTTITTIWSFVPLLLATGIIGEFIKPIPIVVTATLISSTAIAVLITLPLMIVLLSPKMAPRITKMLKILLAIALLSLVFVFSGTPTFALTAIVYIAFLVVAYLTLPILVKRLTVIAGRNTYIKNGFYWTHRLSGRGIIDVEGLAAAYKRTMLRILKSPKSRRRVVIAIIVYAVMSFSLLPLGFVKNEFFPKSDQNEFFVQVEYSPSNSLGLTRQKALALLPRIQKIPHLSYVVLEVGRTESQDLTLSSSDFSALYSVRLTDKKSRQITSVELAEQLRQKLSDYHEGRISVIEDSGGPPAGADVQIKLLGPDLKVLNQQADRIVAHLKTRPGLINVDKSIKPGASKIVFVPDLRKLAELGISQDAVGSAMRLFTSGSTLDQINLTSGSDKKTDIALRMRQGYATPEDLGQIMVSGDKNAQYSIAELGTFEPHINPTTITREDGQRSMSVSAAARAGINATDENALLQKYVDSMGLPRGYSTKTGGANEENTKSVQSILQAMLLSSMLILITMVVQFQSFRKAVIVIMVIPLAVSSVFLAFALTGTPLSFPALIGVLSLFGIVVTNSMFIVDKINLNTREGMGYDEAIADAGASRLEPIILTKLTAVFGLLPITLANALWRGLGGAIISGLLVASSIMLFFIPVVYWSWMRRD